MSHSTLAENDPRQEYYLRFKFSGQSLTSTRVTIVKPGVYYMGHFSGKVKNIGIHWPLEVVKTEGARSKTRENRAFQYLKEKYSDSSWITLIP